MSLLPRLYDVAEGRILIDGKDIRDYRLAALRQTMSIVQQESMVFTGTIFDNLRYGRPHAKEEEVFAAARAAYVAQHQHSRRPGTTLAGFLTALTKLPLPVLRALAQGVRQRLGQLWVPTPSRDAVDSFSEWCAVPVLASVSCSSCCRTRLLTGAAE